jgi:hypothetical protein
MPGPISSYWSALLYAYCDPETVCAAAQNRGTIAWREFAVIDDDWVPYGDVVVGNTLGVVLPGSPPCGSGSWDDPRCASRSFQGFLFPTEPFKFTSYMEGSGDGRGNGSGVSWKATNVLNPTGWIYGAETFSFLDESDPPCTEDCCSTTNVFSWGPIVPPDPIPACCMVMLSAYFWCLQLSKWTDPPGEYVPYNTPATMDLTLELIGEA